MFVNYIFYQINLSKGKDNEFDVKNEILDLYNDIKTEMPDNFMNKIDKYYGFRINDDPTFIKLNKKYTNRYLASIC